MKSIIIIDDARADLPSLPHLAGNNSILNTLIMSLLHKKNLKKSLAIQGCVGSEYNVQDATNGSTKGRFPLRKISIGSDRTGLFFILYYTHR